MTHAALSCEINTQDVPKWRRHDGTGLVAARDMWRYMHVGQNAGRRA